MTFKALKLEIRSILYVSSYYKTFTFRNSMILHDLKCWWKLRISFQIKIQRWIEFSCSALYIWNFDFIKSFRTQSNQSNLTQFEIPTHLFGFSTHLCNQNRIYFMFSTFDWCMTTKGVSINHVTGDRIAKASRIRHEWGLRFFQTHKKSFWHFWILSLGFPQWISLN